MKNNLKTMYIFLFFNIFIVFCRGAFIFDRYLATCELQQIDFPFVSKNWRAVLNNTEIIFNLCGPVNEERCVNHTACIINKKDKSVKFLDKTFSSDSNQVILKNSTSNCTVSIKWNCSTFLEDADPIVNYLEGCDYEIFLTSISAGCPPPPCSTIFNNKVLDLSPLKGIYSVRSTTEHFSISLCGINPYCGDTISSCRNTTMNNIVPLSSGNELIVYQADTNQIEFRKKSKFNGKDTIFELFIKCNWTADEPYVHFIELLKQGKRFKFEMETSYACIKQPPICEFSHDNYEYNLTGIYSSTGHVEVKNVSKSKKLFLNICGPLYYLPKSDNICSKSYSQICELNQGNFINKGSFFTKPKVTNEKISMSLITGSECENGTYQTNIDFYCSKSDKEPYFVKEENCTLFLIWNTTAACPKYDINNCETIKSTKPFQCVLNETFQNINMLFNLTKLHNRFGYNISDANKSLEYHLNVCGPVQVSDAPCMRNAMIAATRLDEVDIRKKVKSFGPFTKLYFNGNNLVMETSGGDFCPEENIRFKSTIFFECSKKDSEITLTKSSSCKPQFLWRTKYACPIKNCIFTYPLDRRYLINLTTLHKTVLNVNVNNTNYLFDLCNNGQSKCLPSECIYVPANKNLITNGNKTYLEFSLDRKCDKANMFNKTTIELVCDKITSNSHYSEERKLSDCTLMFQLKTHLVCFEQDVIIPLEVQDTNKLNYEVDTPKVLHNHVDTKLLKNCTVKNQYTNFEFNISLLNINISSAKCPDIVFAAERQTVILFYELPKSCQKENGTKASLDLRILLKCKHDSLYNSTTNGICSRNQTFELPDACKLLEKYVLSNTSSSQGISAGVISAISVTAILVVITSIIIFIYIMRKRNGFSYAGFQQLYIKDANL